MFSSLVSITWRSFSQVDTNWYLWFTVAASHCSRVQYISGSAAAVLCHPLYHVTWTYSVLCMIRSLLLCASTISSLDPLYGFSLKTLNFWPRNPFNLLLSLFSAYNLTVGCFGLSPGKLHRSPNISLTW